MTTYLRHTRRPKLIVLVRHPITHFQSAYNFFHKENKDKRLLPNPLDEVGPQGTLCDDHGESFQKNHRQASHCRGHGQGHGRGYGPFVEDHPGQSLKHDTNSGSYLTNISTAARK